MSLCRSLLALGESVNTWTTCNVNDPDNKDEKLQGPELTSGCDDVDYGIILVSLCFYNKIPESG